MRDIKAAVIGITLAALIYAVGAIAGIWNNPFAG